MAIKMTISTPSLPSSSAWVQSVFDVISLAVVSFPYQVCYWRLQVLFWNVPNRWLLSLNLAWMTWREITHNFFYFFSRLWQAKKCLLDIMYGYPCDKAVTKNDTREAIWYHFTAVKWCHITSRFELFNQIDWINLVGPIGLHVIFSAEPWRQIWWEELLCSLINLEDWFFWRM